MERTYRNQVYRYVRKVGGRKFQGRVWIDDETGHQNLGTYDTESKAWEAVLRFIRYNELPAHILPKYVRRAPGGELFMSRCRKRGKMIVLGPFLAPLEAHWAMIDLLRAKFPYVPRPWRVRAYGRRKGFPAGKG